MLLLGLTEFICMIGVPITLIGFLIQLSRKKANKKTWGITLIGFLVVTIICFIITPVSDDEDKQADIYEQATINSSTETVSDSVETTPTDDEIEEIVSVDFVEKLMSFGLTEKEADEANEILLKCGVPSIDNCKPTDNTATVDGLIVFLAELDDSRTVWFGIENREIFYVALNGEDLYDKDKGGFLKNFDNVHIAETDISSSEKLKLQELSESILNRYYGYDVRYYDAWGFGRRDNEYMAQCQASDGSLFTNVWEYCYVWFERQDDGEFRATNVKINGQLYEMKE